LPASDLNATKMLEEAYNSLNSLETTTRFAADNGEAFGAILALLFVLVLLIMGYFIVVKVIKRLGT